MLVQQAAASPTSPYERMLEEAGDTLSVPLTVFDVLDDEKSSRVNAVEAEVVPGSVAQAP